MTVMRSRITAIALLVVGVILPATAMAQATGSTASGVDQSLSLELNEGQMVRLNRPAASVFIANPAIADVTVRSTQLVYLFGQKPGKTTLFALDKQDNVILSMNVVVRHNLDRLDSTLSKLLPGAQIETLSIDGGIILNGRVANATQAEDAHRITGRFIGEGEEVINKLAVTDPNQINLRVRIAEVSRDILNRFGFNWDTLFTDGKFLLGFATANPILESTSFLTGSVTSGNWDVEAIVDALADDGLVTVLAEPNLTALSGETASFLAGGEFPIPVSQDNDTITVEFKEFGVSLAFTPTIINDAMINMHVRPEVSQLSSAGAVTIGGIQIPALTTRRAETTVELGSGQSFAIAGLLQNTSQELIKKTPGLGDLPVLGALFKSERFQRQETELVIIVTPYIVKATASADVPLPTDNYTAPAVASSADIGSTAARTIPLPGDTDQAEAAGYMLD